MCHKWYEDHFDYKLRHACAFMWIGFQLSMSRVGKNQYPCASFFFFFSTPSLDESLLAQTWTAILHILQLWRFSRLSVSQPVIYTQSLMQYGLMSHFCLCPSDSMVRISSPNTLPDWFTVVKWIISQLDWFLFHSPLWNSLCLTHLFICTQCIVKNAYLPNTSE